METVREDIASKSGNPKVRQHEEDLDSIVPFIMDKIGSSLILCFSHVVTAHYFMDVQLEALKYD